ncbi:MAG: M14 family metallopeptidase, partial [Bacteroidia bacterium]|nr:M14 family metallopeptidase [Bacteroidia bacterium]
MKKFVLIFVLILFSCTSKKNKKAIDFSTVFETSEGTETATYQQTIKYYSDLADSFSAISIQEIGETDSGNPLHIVSLNPDGDFDFEEIRKYKRIILINNGIHPGESDGIDATMMLYRDLVLGKIEAPKNTVLVTIPIYNVGGSLKRNSTTRTNQNGPKEYGFRANARNYDLNRDFIKSDTKNARAFAQIFHLIQPDIFIDNHVSNGADYQYVITHLFTQHNKLGAPLGEFLHKTMQPTIERKMNAKGIDITPYVNVFNDVPEKGFSQYLDLPRYSTGYTSLFNTLGMMVETHMLKAYKQRVEATYEIMKSLLEFTEEQNEVIADLRKDSWMYYLEKETYPLSWEVDTTKSTTINFKGYEGIFTKSSLTGARRLKYDRSQPFTKEITYHNFFKPVTTVSIPKAYVIPQGWHNVIELLKMNNINLSQLQKDSVLTVES